EVVVEVVVLLVLVFLIIVLVVHGEGHRGGDGTPARRRGPGGLQVLRRRGGDQQAATEHSRVLVLREAPREEGASYVPPRDIGAAGRNLLAGPPVLSASRARGAPARGRPVGWRNHLSECRLPARPRGAAVPE